MYINGIGGIYPSSEINEKGFHQAIEPEYEREFTPNQLRRISRFIKMGMWAGLQAVKDANIQKPNAIITATALGANDDTESFLKSFVLNNNISSPTSFIQSTHNSISGQLALYFSCNGYNNTLTQREFSFESALIDASLYLKTHQGTVLCGGIDEITTWSYYLFHQQRGKKEKPGEGSFFYILSSMPSIKTYGYIKDIILETCNLNNFISKCKLALNTKNISPDNSFFILGRKNDINDLITNEKYQTIEIIPEHGFFYTISAYAIYKCIEIFNNNSSYKYGIFISSENNKYMRMIIIENYNYK
jgi:hypothetical protein